MTIEQLTADMITAMKEGNTLRRDVLRSAIAAIKKAAIDKRVDPDETLVGEVLSKEKKTIKEQLETCPEGRMDLRNQYNAELAIITEYAPRVLESYDEIKSHIELVMVTNGIPAIKASRGAIMGELKGKVDMKTANMILNEILK
jgi:uncharacterized protein YqeY